MIGCVDGGREDLVPSFGGVLFDGSEGFAFVYHGEIGWVLQGCHCGLGGDDPVVGLLVKFGCWVLFAFLLPAVDHG